MKARFILSAMVAAILVWAACESDSLLTTNQDDVAVQMAKKKLTREQKADKNGDGYVCMKTYRGKKRTRVAYKDNSLTGAFCSQGFQLICYRAGGCS